MTLSEAQVSVYRNFVNSQPLPIDPEVTSLLGKNESGKTAFLQALYSIKPAYPNSEQVDITSDYVFVNLAIRMPGAS